MEQRHYDAAHNPPVPFHFLNHRIMNIEHGILPEYRIALPGYTPMQTSSSRSAVSGSEEQPLQHP
jgi:hypothetical protein